MTKFFFFSYFFISLTLLGCDQSSSDQKSIQSAVKGDSLDVETNLGPIYSASLEQGIDFTRQGTPSFLKKAIGLDSLESWGRWSNASISPTVKLIFDQPLPRNFTLFISAQAAGANGTLPVKVKVGDQQKEFIIGTKGISKNNITFNLNGSEKTIEIIPPAPVAPKEQGWGNDVRKLGIGFSSIKLVEGEKN